MSRSEVTLEELSSLLPDLEELELLRLTLVGSAVPDPGKEWDSSSAYATIDKRIVTLSQVERAVNESEEALHHYVSSLYRALRPVVHSFWSGDGAGTVRCLIELGDFLEQSGLYRKARHSYEVAFNRSLPLLDKGPQILALRRIARVALSLGDLQDALSHYQRSAELAHDSGDLHGEIVALTGLGNALVWQGRWTEAERRYREALALVDQANGGERLLLERAQLYNNLGNVATRQMQLEEADRWFSKALEIWTALPSSFDLAVCRHNQALLRDAQDRHEEALAFYRQALDLSIPSGTWAGIAIDFAESLLRDGHVLQAEEWGRAAEERAIAARSPYYLGRMYQGRGNIARAQGDDGGFTFFEKALQIAREKEYPLLEAETLVDYALLRNQTGGVEEAQA
ncbi:MAG TPA: tetratricopeptide repeat protein, partial [Longimicrobiaceae bacterium]|nr:tetratricopeptide repeat protein [Longimicrobiaceae bacterium]